MTSLPLLCCDCLLIMTHASEPVAGNTGGDWVSCVFRIGKGTFRIGSCLPAGVFACRPVCRPAGQVHGHTCTVASVKLCSQKVYNCTVAFVQVYSHRCTVVQPQLYTRTLTTVQPQLHSHNCNCTAAMCTVTSVVRCVLKRCCVVRL